MRGFNKRHLEFLRMEAMPLNLKILLNFFFIFSLNIDLVTTNANMNLEKLHKTIDFYTFL